MNSTMKILESVFFIAASITAFILILEYDKRHREYGDAETPESLMLKESTGHSQVIELQQLSKDILSRSPVNYYESNSAPIERE